MNGETVACPSCGTRFRVRPEVAGRAVRCSRCGQVFTMPAAGGQKPARAPAAEAIKPHGAAPGAIPARGGTPGADPGRGGTPRGTTARGGVPSADTARGDAPGPHTARGAAPSSSAARAGAQDAAEAHERQRDMPEALVGGLDEIDAIPQPGDAPAVGELGLSSAGGPTIHEPAARQGQAGKTSDSACAACGRTLAPSAVICVACGFDRRTGQRVDSELA